MKKADTTQVVPYFHLTDESFSANNFLERIEEGFIIFNIGERRFVVIDKDEVFVYIMTSTHIGDYTRVTRQSFLKAFDNAFGKTFGSRLRNALYSPVLDFIEDPQTLEKSIALQKMNWTKRLSKNEEEE